MDWALTIEWALTGAWGGVAVLAGLVGYPFVMLTHSRPEPTKEYQSSIVLIPATAPSVDALTTPRQGGQKFSTLLNQLKIHRISKLLPE
jgi:hypothetical protein